MCGAQTPKGRIVFLVVEVGEGEEVLCCFLAQKESVTFETSPFVVQNKKIFENIKWPLDEKDCYFF